tara:strand:+ start:110 stop:322 length:213 start_codon:yes stop_codon:yes gene_type:complete
MDKLNKALRTLEDSLLEGRIETTYAYVNTHELTTEQRNHLSGLMREAKDLERKVQSVRYALCGHNHPKNR